MTPTIEQVKERPILFSGAMVRAILEGRKTQTRRVLKLPRWSTQDWDDFEVYENGVAETICASTGCSAVVLCPYGKKGDRLWVRETWRTINDQPLSECVNHKDLQFAADADEAEFAIFRFRPSIHLPRWGSRITLEVTDIRVQRLQEISEEDAIAEGVPPFNWSDRKSLRPVPAFQSFWNSINKTRGFGWDVNPWVWVVSFKCVEPLIHD